MRYSVHQVSAKSWELRDKDGIVLGTFDDGVGVTGYDLAVSVIGGLIQQALAAVVDESVAPGATVEGDGLLPERWVSDQGIAFSERLPGGRDFSSCSWTWRDPASVLVPLMLLDETTDWGHLGAELAGFCEEFSLGGGTVASAGRFYDNEVGLAARNLLLDGRRFGVSVDPTENVTVSFVCTEFEDDGWCIDGDYVFEEYEIGALTMCPIAGFENASIMLDAGAADANASADGQAAVEVPKLAAALTTPARPPRDWFTLEEPRIGEPFLGTLGDEFLVEQEDGNVACPLQILDDGRVFGHLARWGDCHAGFEQSGMCVTPPRSATAYAHFHVGAVPCDDGTSVSTGTLTVGCDHAPHFDAPGARDHYANSGLGWADVRVMDGEYGPWACGVLRPSVTEAQVRLLRSLVPSGDWVTVGGDLELVGALMVNTPGYPIAREVEKLAASAGWGPGLEVKLTASAKGGKLRKLTAAGVVRRCPECEKRAQLARAGLGAGGAGFEREVLKRLGVIERRTRHLAAVEAAAMRARLADA